MTSARAHRKDTKRGGFQPDPLLPVIREAGDQLDAEPGGRLGWLLAFAREDRARWLPGDREARASRLLAIIYGRLPQNMLQLGSSNILQLDAGSVDALHAELSAFFHSFVSLGPGEPVDVPTEGLVEQLIRASAPGKKPVIVGVSVGGPRKTMLFQRVKGMLLKPGASVLACRKCGRPFLALGKMTFCGRRCVQAFHDAKRRTKKR